MLTNKERLLALMDRYALDGVVAATPENVLYMSGFASWKQRNYRQGDSQVSLLFPRDQAQSPALLISSGDEAYASHQDIWVKEIYTYGKHEKAKPPAGVELTPEEKRFVSLLDVNPKGPRHEEALVQLIREKALGKARIGIDQSGLTEGTIETLTSLLPGASFLRASSFFLNVRMVKTSGEVERLRQTATLNQQAAAAILEHCQAGVSEGELAAAYGGKVARAGGQVSWLHLAASRGGNFPPLENRILKNGDIVRMDMGCRLQGYNADTCRSGCIGPPTDKQRKLYDTLQAGVLKSVEAVKPGILPSQLFETMLRTIRAAGHPGFTRHFVGHTIGLEAREFPFALGPVTEVNDPFLPPTTDVPLEPGMTINLETSSHELGWGSVSVEYSLVVTEKGYEHFIPPVQVLYSLPLQHPNSL